MLVFEAAGLALLGPALVAGIELVAGAVLVAGIELVAGAGVGVALATLVLAGLLVALLAGAASPQAIPKALRAKTDESAITFFITNSSLLSSSKNKSNLFLLVPAPRRGLPQTQRFSEANVTIEIVKRLVNPEKGEKEVFLHFSS
jgi:hypothetical protein